ncbi:hypothetical protein Trydic_g9637 [Trypoxylus dichotomus]
MGLLTCDDTIRATTLLQHGRTQQYVANLLGVNQFSIPSLARRLRKTGDVRKRPRQGRKRATMDKRFLTLNCLHDRTTTAVQLRSIVYAIQEAQVRGRTKKVKTTQSLCSSPCYILILLSHH